MIKFCCYRVGFDALIILFSSVLFLSQSTDYCGGTTVPDFLTVFLKLYRILVKYRIFDPKKRCGGTEFAKFRV